MGADRGTEPQPEYSELILSDCYIKKDKDENSMLELVCRVYNINKGKGKIYSHPEDRRC